MRDGDIRGGNAPLARNATGMLAQALGSSTHRDMNEAAGAAADGQLGSS
jgi:hypothetical protein